MPTEIGLARVFDEDARAASPARCAEGSATPSSARTNASRSKLAWGEQGSMALRKGGSSFPITITKPFRIGIDYLPHGHHSIRYPATDDLLVHHNGPFLRPIIGCG